MKNLMNRRLMYHMPIALVALALATAASPALAASTTEARIPFAAHSIRDWRAEDRNTLYIATTGRRWYRAELLGACLDLPFASGIGFVANASGSFDRFSKIVVRGDSCHLKSLVRVEAPRPKDGSGTAA